jgi:uncharacterized protein with NRDE domain
LEFLAKPEINAFDYLRALQDLHEDYAPFNLLAGNFRELHYASNRMTEIQKLPDGFHGLSNHLLNTPWPKVEKGKALLQQWLEEKNPDMKDLLGLMEDDRSAPVEFLPDTGIGLEKEKALSSMFIRMGNYGTCLTTALLLDRKGIVHIAERSHYPNEPGAKDYVTQLKKPLSI